MQAIELFRRCRGAAGDIQQLERRIQQRRDTMLSVTPRMDPTGGSRGGGDPDLIGRILADVDELEHSLDGRKKDEAAEIYAACVILETLTPSESRVLYGYYVRHETCAVIAKKLNYSPGYIRKLKAEGERQLRGIAEATVDALLPDWYAGKGGK